MEHAKLVRQLDREIRDAGEQLEFWLRQLPLHDRAAATGRAVADHVAELEGRLRHLEAVRETFNPA